jgi:hypothetical protein
MRIAIAMQDYGGASHRCFRSRVSAVWCEIIAQVPVDVCQLALRHPILATIHILETFGAITEI